jgi:hypothetical protein
MANAEKGISLHRIPFLNDDRSEAIRRKKRWINFVKARRDKWVPTKNSAVCSEHFTPESFSRRYSVVSESESTFSPRLIQDNFGIVAYLTIHTKVDTELTTTGRERRMVRIFTHYAYQMHFLYFLIYCTLYGILIKVYHSLKIKRKWMSGDDQSADVPSTSSDVPSTSFGADDSDDVPSTSYAGWTSVSTDEPPAQTPHFIEESEPAFKVLSI